MIRGLGAEFHLAEPLSGISGRFLDGPGKEVRIHEVGAGAGNEEASVLYKLHAPEIDLPVAPGRRLDGVSGFGKGRGIQNDHVIELFFGCQGRQELKHIRHLIVYDMSETVESGIFPGLFDGQIGSVHGKHMGCPRDGGIEAEGSGMGEAVQHIRPPADLMDGF